MHSRLINRRGGPLPWRSSTSQQMSVLADDDADDSFSSVSHTAPTNAERHRGIAQGLQPNIQGLHLRIAELEKEKKNRDKSKQQNPQKPSRELLVSTISLSLSLVLL